MDILLIYAPIVLMIILGVPHGALDGYLLYKQTTNTKQLLSIFSLYTLLACLIVALWSVLPTATLAILLLMSAWHFGQGDNLVLTDRNDISTKLTLGGVWAIALPLLQFAEVEVIFQHLNADIKSLQEFLTISMSIWLVLSAIKLVETYQKHQRALRMVWAFGLICVLLLPPLWAICVYFCGWHAVNHTKRVFNLYKKEKRQLIKWMFGITAITVLVGISISYSMANLISLETKLFQIFFVGILALTVPHAIVVDVYLPKWITKTAEHHEH